MLEQQVQTTGAKLKLPAPPRAVRIVLTNAALIALAGPLFFGPAEESGFVSRSIAVAVPLLKAVGNSLPVVGS